MSAEMENARKLVELENRVKAAVAEVGAASSELYRMGKDVKLNGWNWNRPGDVAFISVQGRVGVEVVDVSSRD